jgi:outer membrane lipoprotein SlyB
MKQITLISSLGLAALLLGCAGATYRPIVDTQGLDMNRYEADLQSCQQFATQTADGAHSAAVGAIAGAALGSVIAGIAGGDRRATGSIAALEGGIMGGVSGETNQRNIIRRCLSGRGYRVLQ